MSKKPVLSLFFAWVCALSVSAGMFVYSMIIAPGRRSEEELAQTVMFFTKFIMVGFLITFFIAFTLFYISIRFSDELTAREKLVARIPVAGVVILVLCGYLFFQKVIRVAETTAPTEPSKSDSALTGPFPRIFVKSPDRFYIDAQ